MNIRNSVCYTFETAHAHVCPSSLHVWRHWVGASRPDDDSVAEEDEEDVTRLFRVPHRASSSRRGRDQPTNRSVDREKDRVCDLISIDLQNSR